MNKIKNNLILMAIILIIVGIIIDSIWTYILWSIFKLLWILIIFVNILIKSINKWEVSFKGFKKIKKSENLIKFYFWIIFILLIIIFIFILSLIYFYNIIALYY